MEEKDIVDIILKKSKDIEEITNNYFLNMFGKLHNIPDKYNRFKVKQEVVAKRGYFLSVKKKYALWIINAEGVPVQEMDIKGIAIKRSDYSVITKVMISDILDAILKENKISFLKINKLINDYKIKIEDLALDRSKDIARPVTFSKNSEEYKARIPSHVKSMLFWNEMEYFHFSSGTKGYQFIIRGIDPYKAPKRVRDNYFEYTINNKDQDRISIPYEEEKLPDYYVIDLERTLEFNWKNRVEELLEPIWDNLDLNDMEM